MCSPLLRNIVGFIDCSFGVKQKGGHLHAWLDNMHTSMSGKSLTQSFLKTIMVYCVIKEHKHAACLVVFGAIFSVQ